MVAVQLREGIGFEMKWRTFKAFWGYPSLGVESRQPPVKTTMCYLCSATRQCRRDADLGPLQNRKTLGMNQEAEPPPPPPKTKGMRFVFRISVSITVFWKAW